MNQLTRRGRRILAAAIGGVAVAAGIGGIAYGVGGDSVPEQGYVVVEDGPGTGTSSQDGSTADHDCPERDGSGGSDGSGGESTEPTPDSSATTDPDGQA